MIGVGVLSVFGAAALTTSRTMLQLNTPILLIEG